MSAIEQNASSSGSYWLKKTLSEGQQEQNQQLEDLSSLPPVGQTNSDPRISLYSSTSDSDNSSFGDKSSHLKSFASVEFTYRQRVLKPLEKISDRLKALEEKVENLRDEIFLMRQKAQKKGLQDFFDREALSLMCERRHFSLYREYVHHHGSLLVDASISERKKLVYTHYVATPIKTIKEKLNALNADTNLQIEEIASCREEAGKLRMQKRFDQELQDRICAYANFSAAEWFYQKISDHKLQKKLVKDFFGSEIRVDDAITAMKYEIETATENFSRQDNFYGKVSSIFLQRALKTTVNAIEKDCLKGKSKKSPLAFIQKRLDFIYKQDLPADVSQLLKERYNEVLLRFPKKAIVMTSDPLFLRLIVPHLRMLKGPSDENQRLLARVLTKISGGNDDESDESLNALIKRYIPRHIAWLGQQMGKDLSFHIPKELRQKS